MTGLVSDTPSQRNAEALFQAPVPAPSPEARGRGAGAPVPLLIFYGHAGELSGRQVNY